MKYRLETLGCKVNEYESNYYAQQLEAHGFERSLDHPDVLVVNTCTVTNKAAAKSRKILRRLKREHPQAKLVLTGCLSTFMTPSQLQELQVDALVPTLDKGSFVKRVQALLDNRPYESEIRKQPVFESMPLSRFQDQHRAFLKIQDGCNQFCAYCQIPLARGAERSGSPQEILQIARELYDKGHREIVLTGIHTGRFFDNETKTNLAGLLGQLLENTPDDLTFRISSIEITEVSDELIRLMAQNPRILPHLHIPIQSGDDRTLARMGRPYTIRQFLDRLETIRQELPDISISTDVITGFVGESEQEFAQTRQTLQEAGFSFLHVFGYSRRQGTRADQMEGHLDPSLIHRRTGELLKLSQQLRKQDMARFSQAEVLIEEEASPGWYRAHTPQYHQVLVHSERPLEGRVRVALEDGQNGVYKAEVIA